MSPHPKTCFLLSAAAALLLPLAGCDHKPGGGSQAGADAIKIGFLVKQPEEPWFQTEWKFAQKAADENHFQLIKIGTPDGEKALAAIDNLAAQGAQGFVICTPDVRLGPAIAAKAQQAGLKCMSVDDQFVGPDGKIMDDVPHLGMSPGDIGHQAGELELAEMKRRGWDPADTAVCVFELRGTRHRQATRRTARAARSSPAAFPRSESSTRPTKPRICPAPLTRWNVCLTQHPDVKHWLIVGMNDSAVLGGVRATEGRGLAAADVIGIGINGTDCASEFEKPQPTGFFGSLLLSPNKHGQRHDDDDLPLDQGWHRAAPGRPPSKPRRSSTATTGRAELQKQGLL